MAKLKSFPWLIPYPFYPSSRGCSLARMAFSVYEVIRVACLSLVTWCPPFLKKVPFYFLRKLSCKQPHSSFNIQPRSIPQFFTEFFAVHVVDHLRSRIICGPFWGSFAVLYSLRALVRRAKRARHDDYARRSCARACTPLTKINSPFSYRPQCTMFTKILHNHCLRFLLRRL